MIQVKRVDVGMYLRALNTREGREKAGRGPVRDSRIMYLTVNGDWQQKARSWWPRYWQRRNGEWNTPVPSLTAYHLGFQKEELHFWLKTEYQSLQLWILCPLPWNDWKSLAGRLMMTSLLHRKSWANDMAKEETNERNPLRIVGIHNPFQWSI